MSTTIRPRPSLALCISIGDSYEWEKNGEIGEIYVYELIGICNNDLERVVLLVKDVIKMFKIPLLVRNGDKSKKEDLPQETPHPLVHNTNTQSRHK